MTEIRECDCCKGIIRKGTYGHGTLSQWNGNSYNERNFDICKDCADSSMKTEFSVCHDIEMKHPDEAEQVVVDWTEFMTRHQGHSISFILLSLRNVT